MSEQAIRRGRDCTVCTSVFREDIEKLLAAGGTYAEARRVSHIFEESISRHWENHVAPVVRDRYRSGNALTAITIASRMVELLEAAREIRLRAGSAGRDATALRAVAVEADLVVKMADRLGVDHSQSLPELEELVALRSAVGAVARSHPDAAERVAVQVELTHPEVASAIRLQFLETKEVPA